MNGVSVCVPYDERNVNILFAATVAAVGLRAAAASAGLVDEDGGELLIIERTVRSGSCRGTKRADHCERRFGC